MSKVSTSSKKSSKASKASVQNIELQITQIDSELDINNENILHDGNGNSSETKKQKKTKSFWISTQLWIMSSIIVVLFDSWYAVAGPIL